MLDPLYGNIHRADQDTPHQLPPTDKQANKKEDKQIPNTLKDEYNPVSSLLFEFHSQEFTKNPILTKKNLCLQNYYITLHYN